MSRRKMAAIFGKVRCFLMAMPFLRAFTAQMLKFVNQNQTLGWDLPIGIPQALREEIRGSNLLTAKWAGRPFTERIPVRNLHSDS